MSSTPRKRSALKVQLLSTADTSVEGDHARVATEHGDMAEIGAHGGEPAAPMIVADARAPTKISIVLDLLRRAGGATLPELTKATGWLPHSTRAALTGLRKKGHPVTRARRDEVTCYHIPGAA